MDINSDFAVRGVAMRNRSVVFVIRDKKILMEKHTLDLAGTGIGIQNVVTRLRMYYGEDLSVVLESEPEKGTKFTFWLPIPENPEKDIE